MGKSSLDARTKFLLDKVSPPGGYYFHMEDSVKKQALQRLAIAEGHLKKVRKMVEDEDYCPDVIHQSQAVQAALKKVDEMVLHGHLHSCVLHDIHEPAGEKEKIVREIVEVFTKSQ